MKDKSSLAGTFTIQHWKELFRWETWRLKDWVENRRLLAQLLSFGIIYLGLYGLISFLLPLELRRVRVFVLLVLLVYVVVEQLLMRLGILRNFYDLLDENQPAWREVGFILVASLTAALFSYVFYNVPFLLAIVLWLPGYAFQTFLSNRIVRVLRRASVRNIFVLLFNRNSLLWMLCILLVLAWIKYYEPLRIDTSPSTPMSKIFEIIKKDPATYYIYTKHISSAQAYITYGVLFALNNQGKITRFEYHHDIGFAFLLSLFTKLGYSPSLRTTALLVRDLYLLGCLLFALMVGVFVFRSAMSFLTIAIVLLTGYEGFANLIQYPGSEFSAAIGLFLVGLALVVTLPYMIRNRSLSSLIWWGILSGTIIGVVHLNRANVGAPLLVSILIIVFILSLVQRKNWISITAILLSILCGRIFITSFLPQGLFLYRDAKLQIPPSSGDVMLEHLTYFSLLGGLEDVGWSDRAIYRTIVSENPLVSPIDPIAEPISRDIYIRHILQYPSKFLDETLNEAINTFKIVLEIVQKTWLNVLFMIMSLLFIGGMGILFEKIIHPKPGRLLEYPEIDQSILVCLLTILLNVLPIVLTVGLNQGVYIYPTYFGIIVTTIFLSFKIIRNALM
ncbi:MAG: hypothetical protein MUO64_19055 [Anaerolineales bacterium]|nr:hypothetical protein [Anaerolineales bacterium]